MRIYRPNPSKDAKSSKGLQSEQHVAIDVCKQTLLTGKGTGPYLRSWKKGQQLGFPQSVDKWSNDVECSCHLSMHVFVLLKKKKEKSREKFNANVRYRNVQKWTNYESKYLKLGGGNKLWYSCIKNIRRMAELYFSFRLPCSKIRNIHEADKTGKTGCRLRAAAYDKKSCSSLKYRYSAYGGRAKTA